MATCINISHPDYKTLEATSNVNPLVLRAKIQTWMANNTMDRFPSLIELGLEKEKVLESLKNLNIIRDNLLNNYNKYGILYHGTSSTKITNEILPSTTTNVIQEKTRQKNLDKVFFSPSEKSANIYAGRAYNVYGGVKKVFKVIPIGTVEIINDSKGTEVYMADKALVIKDPNNVVNEINQYIDSLEKNQSRSILFQKESPNQAKQRILKSLEAQNGFVPAQKYVALVQEVGTFNKENPGSLFINKASSGAYYLTTNQKLDQLKSKSNQEKNKELDEILTRWAKKHGIEVMAIQEALKRYPNRYESKVNGFADLTAGLIAIADDSKIDTLAEEVAHFAVEFMIGDPSYQRALDRIHRLPEYAEVKKEYENVYADDLDFRKETLGKIIAKEIVSKFQQSEVRKTEDTSFWNYVKAATSKFLRWVKSFFSRGTIARIDVENINKFLVESILSEKQLPSEQIANMVDAQFGDIYYQLEESEEETPKTESYEITKKKEFLNRVILQLSERVKMLENAVANNKSNTIPTLKAEINAIERALANSEIDLGIYSFIELAESELSIVKDILDSKRSADYINPKTLASSRGFVDMYNNILGDFLKNVYEYNIPLDNILDIKTKIENANSLIKNTSAILDALEVKESAKILDAANLDPNGEKIDKDFDGKTIAEATHEDMSSWRVWIGLYKNANSSIIRAAHKLVFNSIANVKRFTVRKANKLLQAQELFFKSGGKILDLVEKDVNGKPTDMLIRKYNYSAYYAEMQKTKDSIAEELGYEKYEDIQVALLDPVDQAKYNNAWRRFFNQNARTIKTKDEETGAEITKTIPQNKYINKEYEEIMKNPAAKNYYDTLIETKQEGLNKLPHRYRTERNLYMIPSVLKSTLDRMTNSDDSYMARASKLAREAFFVENDETQFGQLNVLNNKMVPIHFVNKLDNISDLSYDLGRSYTLFSEMAENFQEMNKTAAELNVVSDALAQRKYIKKEGFTQIETTGVTSNELQALNILKDTHVYGIQRTMNATTEVPSNRLTESLGIAGHKFSWTKFSQRFASFIRNNNLAFNIPTSLSGWLKGSGDSIIEDQIGIYTTNESKNWARIEFGKNIFHVISEVGKAKQTNKMHLLLQEMEIVKLESMLYETGKNRATRKVLNRDILYTTFATGDYGLKGRVSLAIYDNYRLYNGNYMTRARFYEKTAAERGVVNDGKHQKSVSKEWEALREKSLYNAYEVVDGQLSIKEEFAPYVTETLLNSVKGKIEHVATTVDGTLSATDKGALARTWAGDFLLMHRGWFLGLIDTRFKKENVNFVTEEEEIGTYRATGAFIGSVFYSLMKEDKGNLQAAYAKWDTLSPARKRGVAKAMLDLLYLNIVAFLAAIVNVAADEGDDDDWTLQFAAYQLNRLLLEQGAAFSPKELVQIIDEPVVGARMIKDLADLTEMWNFGESYKQGMYKGYSHATKWWMKKLPTRNLYELQFPEQKNKFIKTMTESNYYDWMSPKQKHSAGLFSRFFLPKGMGQDADSKKEALNQIIYDLQEDTSEENGFN